MKGERIMFKKNLKRAVTMAMTACLMVGATAGCGNSGNDKTTNPTPTTAVSNNQGTTNNDGTTNNGSDNTGDTTTVADTYTYNYALSSFPTNWNIHDYETTTDAEILDYIVDGFFVFDYNDTLDGYKLVPGMAVAEPEDVTSSYVGKFGVKEGESARVWKITLRDDLKWEDGTKINAHSFVTSAELLLNPLAQNHRADMLYSGDMAIVGAKDFLYQGQHAYSHMINEDFTAGYIVPADYTFNENGVLYINGNTDNDIVVNITGATRWSSNALSAYYNSASYKDLFVKDGVDLYATVLQPNADEAGYVSVTQEVIDALNYIVAGLHGHANVEAYAEKAGDYAYQEWQEFASVGATYGTVDFSTVGVIAESDNELVLVLEKPLEGFYLLYALTSTWLVKEDLYNKCMTVKDGVYTSTYGTSVETTASYGPYKLTSFQADKEYTLERNENFYGCTEDTYQTTTIKVSYVAEPSTRLEMFLSGQLDSYGLSADDMDEYQSSDYTYYTTTPSTYFIALNPNMEALKSEQAKLGADYNKTILTVKEFRQALSFALDRSSFTLAVSPTNGPAFSIFSDLIISDPENGVAYRTTEEAKQVLVDFWGLTNEIGDGKMYATKDEAIDSITGYNLAMAKQYFDIAYDKAIEQGLMDENDKVQIHIGLPNGTSAFYSKGYEFLVNCYTEAVVGTKLEGKLEFTKDDTLGNGFGDALRENRVDMLFGVGWNGSALNPYGLVEAYTAEDYRYNHSWETEKEQLVINLDGVDYTATIWDWTQSLSGVEIEIYAVDGTSTTKKFAAGSSDGVDELRFQVLVALEGAILDTYHMIPMMDASSASLKGMQYEYYTEDYIYGVGRGGVKYYTYNYTDAEWDAYVASQGGKLNYK